MTTPSYTKNTFLKLIAPGILYKFEIVQTLTIIGSDCPHQNVDMDSTGTKPTTVSY